MSVEVPTGARLLAVVIILIILGLGGVVSLRSKWNSALKLSAPLGRLKATLYWAIGLFVGVVYDIELVLSAVA